MGKKILERRWATIANKRNNGDREWRTSFILWFARFFTNAFKNIGSAVLRAGYTQKTKTAYFRKKGARIGKYCEIAVSKLAAEPYLVDIGNHVFIAEGVILHTHDGAAWVLREKEPDLWVYGAITIEDNCVIGWNAQILPNVRIGRNSIVGAGSVVITDVPPNSIVMGIPARVVSSVAKYEEKCFAKWEEQRLPDLDQVKGNKTKKRKSQRRFLTDLLIKQNKKEGGEAD